MLIEAEVITYCDQWSVAYDLGIGSEHDLKASAKIQVFIAGSTHKGMSPNRVGIIPESTHMVINQASPRIFASINTDTTVNRTSDISRNIITCVINKKQDAGAY